MNHQGQTQILDKEESRAALRRLTAMDSGISMLTDILDEGLEAAPSTTDVLLLSCMDFRLTSATKRYMSIRGLRNRYDHVVLAGASLGAVTDQRPAWNETFWDHLDIAIKLHDIHTVIIMDHRDCGAYKVIIGPEHAADPCTEKATHAEHLTKLKAMIHDRYPKLKIETLLMALDGTVETLD